jgi:large subunit ribosomal protein L21
MNNYVIVKYKSKQFKVGVGDIIDVDKIDSDQGDFVKIDDVLFLFKDGKSIIGNPVIKKEFVSAKIIEHYKTPKRVSGKYKNKTRNRKRFGHRKSLTKIQIVEIPGLMSTKSQSITTDSNNDKSVKPKTKKVTKSIKSKK